MTRLRIGHYYPWVYLTSGVERTILEIVRRSRHEHTVFTNHFDLENTYPEFSSVNVVELERVSVKRSIGPVMRAALTLALQKLPLQDIDCLIVHCDGLGDAILIRSRSVPCVCFCHTPLRVVFDPVYRSHAAKRYRGLARVPFEGLSSVFSFMDRLLWSKYEYVIFNSRETLERAKRGKLLSAKSKYSILHPGCDLSRFVPSKESQKFFLVPGRIMWTKNIETSMQGFFKMKSDHPELSEYRLVIAGRVDHKSKPYLAKLRDLAASRPDVEFTVNPTDDDLVSLYRNCYGVICMAENEDWGMVALEANACAKPVVATNAGGLAESQSQGVTAILVSPETASVGEALSRLAADPELARTLGSNGLEQSKHYDWSPFVEKIDTLLESVFVAHPHGSESAVGIPAAEASRY
jgi:glycosyltransferase involved in cell wall biosynthesis